MDHNFDILIIGGGVFGMTAAIELTQRKYKVGLINPDSIPHHLAASTDITKVVRTEYGTDKEYFNMADISIERFHEWNDLLGEKLYHEVGFLMLCQESLDSSAQTFERESIKQLSEAGYPCKTLDARDIAELYPALSPTYYKAGNLNPRGGYVSSGKLIAKLADYARSLGTSIIEGQTAHRLLIEKGQLHAVQTKEGATYHCDHALVAAGAHTPYLLPELSPYIKITGHPVFWLRPEQPDIFRVPNLSVFTADISNTGWYGFPYSDDYGVIKIAKHTNGTHIHPDKDDRRVSDDDVKDMRAFVAQAIPSLLHAPLVYTRRCLYTDTLDGHYWIDHHPEVKGLSVATGGSGHAMKMAPILGEMTADMIEGKPNQFSDRYRWRHLSAQTHQNEQARHVPNRKL